MLTTARTALATAAIITAAALVPVASASAQSSEDNLATLQRLMGLPAQTDMTATTSAGTLTGALPGSAGGVLGANDGVESPQPLKPGDDTAPETQQQQQTQQPRQQTGGQPEPATRKRNGTTCKRKGHKRTCVTYRNGRAVKRCVKNGHHRAKCVRIRVHRVARSSSLNWQGFLSSPMRTVGKVASETAAGAHSYCTGTVVSRSLVLTAAHCVLKDGAFHKTILFVPAMSQSGSSFTTPYGVYKASRWWVPSAYKSNGDISQDYALLEIAPLNGRNIGDALGTWGITYGPGWNTGTRVYAVGYPANGWFGADGRTGTSQYGCDTTYASYEAVGTGYQLWSQCTMNQGSSGGPWFVQAADGSWSVRGVVSRCSGGNLCSPASSSLSTAYFDDRIASFWNAVAQIRGANG